MEKERCGTKQKKELINQVLEARRERQRVHYQNIKINFDNNYTTEKRWEFINKMVSEWKTKNHSTIEVLASLIGISSRSIRNWMKPVKKDTSQKTITRGNAIALGLAMRLSVDDITRLVLCSGDTGMFPREGVESEIVDFVNDYFYNNGEYPSIEMVNEYLISTQNEGVIKKKNV